MAQKKTDTTQPDFSTQIGRACAAIGVTPFEGTPPETRGRWKTHSERLHGACADIRERGGRYVEGLGFDAGDMRCSSARYQSLCGAEQVLGDALRNVRAAKEAAKGEMLDQSTQVIAVLTCQEQDPRTRQEDRRALRALLAPAQGLVDESNTAVVGKAQKTRERNAGYRATIDALTTENEVLRQGQTLDSPPPAPRAARRRTRR